MTLDDPQRLSWACAHKGRMVRSWFEGVFDRKPFGLEKTLLETKGPVFRPVHEPPMAETRGFADQKSLCEEKAYD